MVRSFRSPKTYASWASSPSRPATRRALCTWNRGGRSDPMLSLQVIRENTDRVKRDILLRNTTAPIDRILVLDEERRKLLGEVEALRARRNAASKEIGATRDPAEREHRVMAMRLVGDEIDR